MYRPSYTANDFNQVLCDVGKEVVNILQREGPVTPSASGSTPTGGPGDGVMAGLEDLHRLVPKRRQSAGLDHAVSRSSESRLRL